jgi:hypothetical protein
MGSPSIVASLVFGVVSLFIVTATVYALAAVSLLGPTAATSSGPLPATSIELFMRGFLIGITASVNFSVWAIISGNPLVGLFFGLINFLAAIPGVSATIVYQVILGWTSWSMPMSYLATALGLLLFLINLPFAFAAFGPVALRFDPLTATIETTGGLTGITGTSAAGFNLGNFTFLILTPGPGITPAAVQTGFGVPGTPAHETGHTLSVAGLGGFYHWVNAIDENVLPLRRLTLAYGEMVAESHFPRSGLLHVRVWS